VSKARIPEHIDWSKKSYPEICLERAEKATPGPWKKDCNDDIHAFIEDEGDVCALLDAGFGYATSEDRQFIAAARTDVVELATRLRKAISLLRDYGDYLLAEDIEIVNELEAPPGDK
jgi:hypothetical protein